MEGTWTGASRNSNGMVEPVKEPADATSSGHRHVSPQAALAGGTLGEQLTPLLRQACDGRLGTVAWFKADWQRGGARTGKALYRDDEKGEVSVIVKIPVGPKELLWNRRMQPCALDRYGVTARLYASDEELGSYDLAWLVMERFAQGPLLHLIRDDSIDLMADAAARFYRIGGQYPVEGACRKEDWGELLEKARANCSTNHVAHAAHWAEMIRKLQKSVRKIGQEWDGRACQDWCHGDLHLANCMSRSDKPEDPAMLIDLAEVHVGHWVEDAVYLERLFWARREYIAKHPPVKLIGARRKELGLPDDSNAGRLADIRRALLAGTAPAFMRSEGNPRYLDACLGMLDEALPRIK